jgi:hypothetical protein
MRGLTDDYALSNGNSGAEAPLSHSCTSETRSAQTEAPFFGELAHRLLLRLHVLALAFDRRLLEMLSLLELGQHARLLTLALETAQCAFETFLFSNADYGQRFLSPPLVLTSNFRRGEAPPGEHGSLPEIGISCQMGQLPL